MIPIVYHPIYSQLELPQGHRYPINKYHLLWQYLQNKASLDSGYKQFQLNTPEPLDIGELQSVHCAKYIDRLVKGTLEAAKMRRIGFPWSQSLIERTLTSAGGTCLTVELAVEHGLAIHLSGGYHHAHFDYGSGFCLVNDLVLAAKRALTLPNIDKVLIVDSDVHQGDGTATLCNDENDIITLSFHCDKNFPARKPASDMDVALARGTEDDEFLQTFESVVAMALNLHQPDLILYDAGVDIHTDDELGYFNVSTNAIYQRDLRMFHLAKTFKTPVACVVGGGYRTNHADLVPIHWQLFEAALTSIDSSESVI